MAQTTFTISEIRNWLDNFGWDTRRSTFKEHLSEKNIIKANQPSEDNKWFTEALNRDELNTMKSMDYEDEISNNQIDIIMKSIPEVDNPQSFSITKEDLDNSNKEFPEDCLTPRRYLDDPYRGAEENGFDDLETLNNPFINKIV